MKKTRIYCPGCKLLTISVVEDETEQGRLKQKRSSVAGHIDIQVFQRIRVCSHCRHRFKTGEVSYELLEELAALRLHFDLWQQRSEDFAAQWKAFSKTYKTLAAAVPKLTKPSLGLRLRQMRSKRHQQEILTVINSRESHDTNSTVA